MQTAERAHDVAPGPGGQLSVLEVWRAVPEFEGVYEVSSLGRVRRVGPSRGATPGRILNARLINSGYLVVTLNCANQRRGFLAHRLVAAAFLGPVPIGHEVNHLDGDKLNNGAHNLEYVTRSENLRHAMTTKGCYVGERNHRAKLTAATVRQIKALYVPGHYGLKRLARRFGVTPRQVARITSGGLWTSVTV